MYVFNYQYLSINIFCIYIFYIMQGIVTMMNAYLFLCHHSEYTYDFMP
jgi:hypothetical protein